MIIRNSFILRFYAVAIALFVLMGSADAKEDKAITKEKVRRQGLHKAWLNKKLDNDTYYLTVDAPTVAGCQQSIVRTKRLMKVYSAKLSKAKTPRIKKKYIGALKAYKVYGETLVEVMKAFKAKDSGKVSTELYPILRKCEKRIVFYTGRSVKRSYFFTPEVYPEYFKSKAEKAEDAEESEDKSDANKSEDKEK